AGRVGPRRELGERAAASATGIDVRRELRRDVRAPVRGLAADAEVGEADAADPLRLVEEVVPVPVPELGRLALDDRARPVVALEVEALRRRGGDPVGLLFEEVGDAEVGDVLVRLV